MINQFRRTNFENKIESGGLKLREDIDKQYKWNLEDIYDSEEDWERDFQWLKESVKDYQTYKGCVTESAQKLKECLHFDDSIGIRFGKLYLYAMLSRDLNLADTKFQGIYQRAMLLASKLETAASFIKPEIIDASEDLIWQYCSEDADLKVYEQLFKDLFRTKEHTLDSDKEQILAQASPALSAAGDTFSLLTNADFEFPEVEDENGNLIEVSHGRFTAALHSLDRKYRQRVYKAYYKPFIQYRNTLSSLFDGNIKASIFNASVRNYASSREAALFPNNIPISVYDNLVDTVEQNLEPINRWCSLKKKILGVDEFRSYDIYVTLFPSVHKTYSYDESVQILYSALKPLGDEYINDLKKAFENRWIDVYESKGKRSGAYSSGTTFGIHPYVLLNWNNQLNDLFTLAHEMGHNMHSYYTGNYQPYPYANYSIFNAEVTSTVNEALLLKYLIENAKSKDEKLSLIERHIIDIVSTFYRQVLFASFEQTVHENAERGEALTPDILCKIYGDMHLKYWGKDMTVDEEETYTWARVPHFYYNFYVYQYATSFAASKVLVDKFITDGPSAKEAYLDFLKSGSSDYPINLLKKAGVDMNSPAPILSVTKKMNALLDQMEELLNS